MESVRSRRFALLFGTIMVVLAVTLVVFAERAIRSRGEWTMEVRASEGRVSDVTASWTIELTPSVPAFVYAIVEGPDGSLRLHVAGPSPEVTEAIPPERTFPVTVRLDGGETLLVMADPRPLWSIEEARAKARRTHADGPWLLDLDSVLEVRGVPKLPQGSSGARVSQVIPKGTDGEDRVRGLWARRWP